MTTLATLKAEIADDMARGDITSQIASAITNAINYYKAERFYFNETRSATFATVAGTSTYASSDDADIPLFLELDAVHLEDSSTSVELRPESPTEIDWLIFNNTGRGKPYCYAWFDESFRLFPIPDAVYTIRPIGHIEEAAPAADGTADNVWMTKAYELIRCRAKMYLAAHVIKDVELVQVMRAAEEDALQKLRRNTAHRFKTGRVVSTSF